MDSLTPRLAERAALVAALEEDIIFGRLPPGTRLVEEALMTRFGATRHLVRQALDELARIGIVVQQRNVGATVRSYTQQEVLQIYEVREVLQRHAVLMIPLPAPALLLQRLEALNAAFANAAEAGDLRAVHDSNDAFHLTLFGASGNPHLVRSIRDYMGLSLPMRARTLADPVAFATSHRHHTLMVAMMRERCNWSLAQLCADHVQPSKLDYISRIAGSVPALLEPGGRAIP